MTVHQPTLLFACIAMLALSAAVMTLFGLTQRTYRGYWWWTAAQWLLTLGLVMHALRGLYPALLPIAQLLLLQWPISMLAGLRIFYSRHGLELPASTDWLLLSLAFVAWLASWALQGGLMPGGAGFSAGAMLLQAYAAFMLWRLAEFRSSTALRVLFATELLTAGVQAVLFVYAVTGEGTSAHGDYAWAGQLAIVISALVTVNLALLLTGERTEHNLRTMQRKLRFLADMDMLTRVPNRRHFYELATQTLNRAEGGTSTLLMFDIDHFKRVNDTLGHASGDEALRQVSRCVRDTLRDNDLAGRLGGDEFALLLPQTRAAEAMAVAARIVSRLDDRQVAPRIVPISLSFGVVQLHIDEDIASALRRADQALYEAKRQGRSRVVIAEGEEQRPVFTDSQRLGLHAL